MVIYLVTLQTVLQRLPCTATCQLSWLQASLHHLATCLVPAPGGALQWQHHNRCTSSSSSSSTPARHYSSSSSGVVQPAVSFGHAASPRQHTHASASVSASPSQQLQPTPQPTGPYATTRTPPAADSSTSSNPSSSGGSNSSGGSGSSSNGSGGGSPSFRRPGASSVLAAAAERLEQAPTKLSSPLAALAASGVGHYQSHPLPAVEASEEQQQALDKATSVIKSLRSAGYSALIAGGWVRDAFLGRRASDIDIATSATPRQVRAVFNGYHTVQLPRSTVKVNYQGEVFELSCFKGISRAPSLFSVGLDAVRRDFTLNALYYNPETREVLDFVGGVQDATSKTLRLTNNDTDRLKDDPLRVLRGVRFVTGLGVRLAPGTAAAMQAHAHLCSIDAGVPPRRIWLELRKLAALEASQPGSWLHALKLSFHLGLLPHLFPWLKPPGQQQRPDSTSSSGAASDTSNWLGSSAHNSSSNSGSSAISSPGGAGQAVMVAERLTRLLQQAQGQHPKQQQRQSRGSLVSAAGALPLPLLVAATVHPSQEHYRMAEPYLRMFFPEPSDWKLIQTLQTAAKLTAGGHAGSSFNNISSSSSSSSYSSSSSCGGSHSSSGPEGDEAWVQFYAQQHAPTCLAILACWMHEVFAANFMLHHEARMAQLAARIQQCKDAAAQEPERQPVSATANAMATATPSGLLGSVPEAAKAADSSVSRRNLQSEELSTVIHALVGEQESEEQQ